MGAETRIIQHGSVYAMGIWLATVEYITTRMESNSIELQIRVTNGERDLSESSIFAEELVLELADGRRRRMIPLSGSVVSGTYRVRLEGEPLTAAEPHAAM